MDPSRNVVLVGMPAVGKSTVGVLLAKRLGFSFVDTDIVIQALEGRTLQEILDAEGAARFRELEERRVLELSVRRHVIATGGSVVYSEAAMRRLSASGIVIHLDLDLESLSARLSDIGSRGVVMEPGETLSVLLERRRPLYLRHASVTLDCAGLSPERTVERLLEILASA